jgi:putative ABC transport system ATP-binding protein
VPPALIVARDLAASYGSGRLRVPVLDGASFAIERGSLTAITGPSGSGKTTLLSLVGGLDVPERGSLHVDGTDLTALSTAALAAFRRAHVGFVFQAFHLLPHLTVRENVEAALAPLRPPRADRRRRALAALEDVGLAALADRFPHELSGGEQQRVAVARACAKAPMLLLADEPTGNLDEASAGPVLDLIERERGVGGRTVVVVTHEPTVAERADRRLRLHDHRVEAS